MRWPPGADHHLPGQSRQIALNPAHPAGVKLGAHLAIRPETSRTRRDQKPGAASRSFGILSLLTIVNLVTAIWHDNLDKAGVRAKEKAAGMMPMPPA